MVEEGAFDGEVDAHCSFVGVVEGVCECFPFGWMGADVGVEVEKLGVSHDDLFVADEFDGGVGVLPGECVDEAFLELLYNMCACFKGACFKGTCSDQ